MKITLLPIDKTKPLPPLHPSIMDGSYRDTELQRQRMMKLLYGNIKPGDQVTHLLPRNTVLKIPIEFTITRNEDY